MKYTCYKNCCEIEVVENIVIDKNKHYSADEKAGLLLYDNENKKVLIVQSNGMLWGLPKGGIEQGESDVDCALRETKEETGITVDRDLFYSNFKRCVKISSQGTYFMLSVPEWSVRFQPSPSSDASGCCWITIDCLKSCVDSGEIFLNHHAKIVFNSLFRTSFHHNGFEIVGKKKK